MYGSSASGNGACFGSTITVDPFVVDILPGNSDTTAYRSTVSSPTYTALAATFGVRLNVRVSRSSSCPYAEYTTSIEMFVRAVMGSLILMLRLIVSPGLISSTTIGSSSCGVSNRSLTGNNVNSNAPMHVRIALFGYNG